MAYEFPHFCDALSQAIAIREYEPAIQEANAKLEEQRAKIEEVLRAKQDEYRALPRGLLAERNEVDVSFNGHTSYGERVGLKEYMLVPCKLYIAEELFKAFVAANDGRKQVEKILHQFRWTLDADLRAAKSLPKVLRAWPDERELIERIAADEGLISRPRSIKLLKAEMQKQIAAPVEEVTGEPV